MKKKEPTPKQIAIDWWEDERKRLIKLRQEIEISNKTLGLNVGLNFGLVYKWLDGISVPSVVNYMIIKRYLEEEYKNKEFLDNSPFI